MTIAIFPLIAGFSLLFEMLRLQDLWPYWGAHAHFPFDFDPIEYFAAEDHTFHRSSSHYTD